jgi:Skp1 family, tetramerisation domain
MSEAATATTKMIKLMSKDDIEIEISVAAGKNSEFIKNALSLDDEEVDDSKELTVDCKRVASKTLESVVQFLTYYAETRMKDIPDPNKEVIAATFEEVVPQICRGAGNGRHVARAQRRSLHVD